MIERFEQPVDLDENGKIEKLDRGIFLEVITREISPAVEAETVSYVCGTFHPEGNPWEVLYLQAVDAGVIRSNGCIVWDELAGFSAECGCSPETLEALTLSDLANMLDNGETVLCQVNDFVLADIRAETLPGIAGNTLVWVAGVDLDHASVALGTNRGGVERVPMKNFLKAWKAGRNRAMVIQSR